MEFNGKVVLITGAGSGMGAAAAENFAAKGAILSLTDLHSDWLKKTVAKISGSNPDSEKILMTTGDLTNEQFREKFVNDSLTAFGKIDILLNVAGMYVQDSILEFDLKAFHQTLNLNLVAPFHLSGLCSQHLVKTQGCIINISSGVSDLGDMKSIAYCVSKAAVDSLTKCTAVGLASHQVRVNSIRPGATATNIGASHLGKELPRTVMEEMKDIHLLNRIAEPSEVAEMMAIIASDKCSFMTGTNLLFDGGFNLKRSALPSISPSQID